VSNDRSTLTLLLFTESPHAHLATHCKLRDVEIYGAPLAAAGITWRRRQPDLLWRADAPAGIASITPFTKVWAARRGSGI